MNPDIQPFDLQRIFFGEAPPLYLLEIVFRATFLYLLALLMLRLMNKRGMSQMSAFEWVMVIALGSAVGDPMFYPEIPVAYAAIILAVVVLWHRTLAYLVRKYDWWATFVEGTPRELIREGKVLSQNLERENLNKEDLYMHLRHEGIRNIAEVEHAYLEVSGKISIFTYQKPSQTVSGESTLPQV